MNWEMYLVRWVCAWVCGVSVLVGRAGTWLALALALSVNHCCHYSESESSSSE